MLELGRLKPMTEGYDEQMFNRLYKRTEGLRRNLTAGIDHKRFGLGYDDILSFFDIKFIYAFNKYHEKFNEEVLLGHLISSLEYFKYRIIKSAYTEKFSQSIFSMDAVEYIEESIYEAPGEPKDFYYNKMMSFMKNNLSQNAYTVLEITLNPPPYILHRINKGPNDKLQKIPDQLLLEYFDLGYSDRAYKFITTIKKEIRNAINYAKLSLKAS